MTSKAKKTPAKSRTNGRSQVPLNVKGDLIVPEIFMLKLRVADAECRMALAEMETANGRVEKAVAAAPAVLEAVREQNLALGRISVRKNDRDVIYAEINKVMGIKRVEDYTIAEKTGVMTLKPVAAEAKTGSKKTTKPTTSPS